MSSIIWYFSGTGNSLYTAKEISKNLADSQMLPIAAYYKEANLSCVEVKNLGFVFPVYAFGLPKIVYDFVEKLEIAENPYIFAVATCGGMPGGALTALDNLLHKKGKRLSAGFIIVYPGNFIPLYGRYPNWLNNFLLEMAERNLAKVIEKILNRKRGYLDMAFFPFSLFCRFFSWVFRSKVNESDQKFWTTSACTYCGICAKVCPVGNITQQHSHSPKWLGRCEQCMACLQYCPQEAIQYSFLTLGRRRYRHPKISCEEIAAQKLVGFAAHTLSDMASEALNL